MHGHRKPMSEQGNSLEGCANARSHGKAGDEVRCELGSVWFQSLGTLPVSFLLPIKNPDPRVCSAFEDPLAGISRLLVSRLSSPCPTVGAQSLSSPSSFLLKCSYPPVPGLHPLLGDRWPSQRAQEETASQVHTGAFSRAL